MAAITPARKLLRHLGASLVLLCRNDGNRRDGHERRKAVEEKETEEKEWERGRREGSRVR